MAIPSGRDPVRHRCRPLWPTGMTRRAGADRTRRRPS